jgi:hypothetical protein
MRSILALAILLLGLGAAAAETNYQDSLPVAGEHSFTSSLEFNVSIGRPDFKLILAEPSDAARDQGEAATEPPAAATPDAQAKKDAAHSVGDLCRALLTSAQDNDLPVPFFANLIWQESRLRLDAVSRVGALGIAQFMPKVAREVGLVNPFDPRQAIPASARFLNALRRHFGNLGFVAAAYNAGTSRVAEWLGRRRALPHETQTYVVRVTGRSAEAWRKSPVYDFQLTFARPLPCRKLPAFADLEAQSRAERQAEEARQQEQQQQEKLALKVAQATPANVAEKGAQKDAQKVAAKVTPKVAQAKAAKVAAKGAQKDAAKVRPKVAQAKAAKVAAKGAEKGPQKGAANVTSKVAQKAEKKVPVARHAVAEKDARPAAGDKIARNVHGGKHEAARPAHVTHEKRRVASRAAS